MWLTPSTVAASVICLYRFFFFTTYVGFSQYYLWILPLILSVSVGGRFVCLFLRICNLVHWVLGAPGWVWYNRRASGEGCHCIAVTWSQSRDHSTVACSLEATHLPLLAWDCSMHLGIKTRNWFLLLKRHLQQSRCYYQCSPPWRHMCLYFDWTGGSPFRKVSSSGFIWKPKYQRILALEWCNNIVILFEDYRFHRLQLESICILQSK